MIDSDTNLRTTLRGAQASKEHGQIPDFDAVWSAAARKARNASRRHRAFAATAVAAVVAASVLGPMPSTDKELRFIDADDFLETTRWHAPSDSLLPEYQIDIYQDLPVLIESTESYGGALL